MNAVAEVTLRLLGRFRLERGGAEIATPGAKGRALLAYLALNADRGHAREPLATLLWGDRGDEQARHSLRQCILSLRKALGDDDASLVVSEGGRLRLDPGAVALDVRDFERLAAAGTRESLEGAAALYAGGLLEGESVRADGFEAWLAVERSRLRNLAVEVLERLADLSAEAGETAAAIDTAQRLLTLDPAHEEGHRTLMRLYAATGRRAEGLRQYRACEEALRRELDAVPGPETVRLYEQIRSAAAAPATAAARERAAAVAERTAPPPPSPQAAVPTRWKPGPWIAAITAVSVLIAAGVYWVRKDPEPPWPLPDKPSVAVLAFDTIGDPGQEYYIGADGVTVAITTELERFTDLFLIDRNTAFTYKGRRVKVRDVGRDLGVRYVVEGSVQRAGDEVLVTAQLADATEGRQVWAERYEGRVEDIFDFQNEITRRIVSSIFVEITEEELARIHSKDTDNLEAYEHVLRGREQLFRLTSEANAEARTNFKSAVELDPRYARAYAYLAWTHLNDWRLGWSTSPESLKQAFVYANQAVSLDKSVSDAHAAVGEVYLWRRQYDAAIAEVARAIELNPNNAGGYASLGDILTWRGMALEALDPLGEAMRLNPRFPFVYLWNLGHAYFVMERYEDAIAKLETARDRKPDFMPAYLYLAASYARLDRTEDARAAMEKAVALNPRLSEAVLNAFLPYERPEDLGRVLGLLRKAGLPE